MRPAHQEILYARDPLPEKTPNLPDAASRQIQTEALPNIGMRENQLLRGCSCGLPYGVSALAEG
jgi:hypothetical protein